MTSETPRYNPTEIEPRWQQRWEELGLHTTDLDQTSSRKFYLLTMYPYPSGDLHIGHWYDHRPDRRDRPLQAHERLQRLLPDRLRRVRPAGGERGDQERHPSARLDATTTSTTCAASCG